MIIPKKNQWEYIQNNSNAILAEGINLIKHSIYYKLNSNFTTCCGNYLISLFNVPYYIGEAGNISKRIKQQSKSHTSTFYKNYIKKQNKQNTNEIKHINNFEVQVMKTMIGRKEIEEFGIVNLPTKLNKFQLDKRIVYNGPMIKGVWDWVQNNYESLLFEAEKSLLKNKLYEWHEANIEIGPGIYYVEHKKDGLIYIGESSNIFERYNTHSGDTRFSALRRHIGTDILGFKLKTRKELGFKIEPKKDRRMYLSADEDIKVNEYLNNCLIRTQIINLGRYELEDYLIKKLNPLLNIKSKKVN